MSPPVADVNSDCYYGVLGVERSATDAEITKAYRRAALKHHPDKCPDDKEAAERFRKVSEAYDALHDPEKRRNYDQFGKAAFGQGSPAPPEGAAGAASSAFPGGGGGVNFQSTGMSSAQAEEMFRMIFGGPIGGGGFGSMGSSMRMPGGGAQTFIIQSGGLDSSDEGGGERSSFASVPFDLSGALGGGFPGSGSAQASSRRAPPAHAMPAGTRVVLQGLAKSPEHNGKTGQVVAWDEASSRYQVQVHGDGSGVLSLRRQNLVQLCRIEVTALESKPELNGRHGEIFGFDESRGRYRVLLEDPVMALSLQASHCILSKGTCITLSGLASDQFNGEMSQIVSVHRDAGRYTVQCQNGRQIRIKYANALC